MINKKCSRWEKRNGSSIRTITVNINLVLDMCHILC